MESPICLISSRGNMIVYHGTSKKRWRPHQGACLTPNEEAARNYADPYRAKGFTRLITVVLDLSKLKVLDVVGYDRESNTAPGDLDLDEYENLGADVIVYTDADITGKEHITYRLVSKTAVKAARVLGRRGSV